MNALQMLQARLLHNAGWAQQEGGEPDPELPSYLPDAVRRSILGQPSYAEGQRIPEAPNSMLGQEFANVFGPQRDAGLLEALQQQRTLFDQQGAVKSDAIPNWSQRSDLSYPGPLNSMMGRYPLALY